MNLKLRTLRMMIHNVSIMDIIKLNMCTYRYQYIVIYIIEVLFNVEVYSPPIVNIMLIFLYFPMLIIDT